ncbi:UvrD-helicase domain-containing protein [Myxococcota bacterium]|nr:UvrD-helicase domain-containing protein [Myxococcota bacterium]
MEKPDLMRRVFSGPSPTCALIEASAGTGKTYTIEHLVLDRVKAGVPISEILLVTFTRKAASELRDRVRLRLSGNAGSGPLVRRALAAFDSATITTIHGFAQLALSWFSIHTPYPFEQELASLEDLFPEVMRDLIRGPWYRDPTAASVLLGWLGASSHNTLVKALMHCAESALPMRFSGVLEKLAIPAVAELKTPQLRQAFDAVLTRVGPKDKQRHTYPGLVSRLLEHAACWQDGLMVLMMMEKAQFKGFLRTCEDSLDSLDPSLRQALETWLALPRSLDGRRTYFRHMAVMVLLPSVRMALDEAKRQRHVMTYDDMIQRLALALADPATGPELVRGLQARFRVGIVDEFQDTDPVQWEILRRLFLERPDGALVVVGDPKQAIYRFRGADILTYQAARLHLQAVGGVQVHLETNYRCTRDMVDAVNHFFRDREPSSVFSVQDVRYDHPLDCGKPDLRLEPRRPPVVILGQQFCSHVTRDRWAFELARQIAKEIRDLVRSGTRLAEPGQVPRILGYRDVFILVQKHAEGRIVSGVLREAGIPFSFYRRQTLFEGPEARGLLDVLEAILRPHHPSLQNRAFVTPFFGMDLVGLAQAGGLPRHHRAVRTLLAWNELARDGELAHLLSALWFDSGVRERLFSGAATRRDAINLERIFGILRHELVARPMTADLLVGRLREWVLNGSRDADSEDLLMEVTDPGENAVRILTMHNAKGLEAPVVFLYGGFSKNLAPPVHEFHSPTEGRRVLHVGKLEAKDPERPFYEEEELGDAQRLMYVAMTRAKALCYLQIIAEPLPDPESENQAGFKELFRGAKATVRERVATLRDEVGVDARVSELFEVRITGTECRDCRSYLPTPDQEVATEPPGTGVALETLVEEVRSCLEFSDIGSAVLRARVGKPVFSYSSLKKRAEISEEARVVSVADALPEVPATDPPPGVHTGLCVHELCETVDLFSLRSIATAEDWLADPAVESWILAAVARQELPAACWRRIGEMVFSAFRTPLAFPGCGLPPLGDCDRIARELEFRIPYDPALAGGLESILSHPPQDDGWVMGFFDAVLRLEGRLYIVDWKTDLLRDYTPETVAAHVRLHYALQARLYAAALARMLGIGSEEAWSKAFGGFLYVFVRGFGPGSGVVRLRPEWKELSG